MVENNLKNKTANWKKQKQKTAQGMQLSSFLPPFISPFPGSLCFFPLSHTDGGCGSLTVLYGSIVVL